MNALSGSEFVCRICMEYFDSAANVPASFPCGHSCCRKHTLTMVVCHVCGATVPDNLTADLILRDGAVELIERAYPYPLDTVLEGNAEASGKKSGKKKKKRKSKKKASASSAFVPPASVDDISDEEGIAILFQHGVLTPQAMEYLKDDCVFRYRFRIESLPLFTAGKHENFWSLAIDALTGWLFFAEIVRIDECEEGTLL